MKIRSRSAATRAAPPSAHWTRSTWSRWPPGWTGSFSAAARDRSRERPSAQRRKVVADLPFPGVFSIAHDDLSVHGDLADGAFVRAEDDGGEQSRFRRARQRRMRQIQREE